MKRFYTLFLIFIFTFFTLGVGLAGELVLVDDNSVSVETKKDKADEVVVVEEAFAYDGFSGNDYGWSGSWFEYSTDNGNRNWNADFKGYNYAYSKGEVSLSYVDPKSGISIMGGNECVKSTTTASGSQSAALSRTVAALGNPLQQTFYVSFLAQFSEAPKKGWDYIAVGAKQSNYDAGVALGSIYSKDKLGAVFAKDGSTIKHTSGKLPAANETYFIVGKFTTNSWGSVTAIDMFINPTSLTDEKASWEASIKNSGYSKKNFYYYLRSIQLMSYFHGVAYFDEIRIGHSWGGVVSPIDNSGTAVNPEANVTVFEGPTGDWNEVEKWSNGLPTADVDTVIIEGQCAVSEEVEANDVVVSGNGKLYVAKGGKIKTSKTIKLKAAKNLVAEYMQEDKVEDYTVEKEQYFSGGQWSFVCVPQDMTADELFPDLKLASSWSDEEAEYWLLDYSQEQRAATKDGMKDVFDGDYKLYEGRGYIVWLDEDKLRTFKYTSSKSEVSVSTTNSTATALSLNHAGWNLVGNPFSHTMSYEAVFDSSEHNQKYFNGAVYVWDGEVYEVWSRGVGDEGAREIQPLEAFFVKRTSDDPASAVFMMNDIGSYSSFDNTIFSKSAEIDSEPSSLAVSVNLMKGQLSDQTYIKIDPNASLGLDENLDGLKLQTSSAYNDYIYSTDYEDVFAVNSVALDGGYAEVPLIVNLAQGMDSILLGFTLFGDSTHSFALVDEDEMTIRPIEHGDFLSIASEYEGTIEGRFSIFVTKALENETPIQTLSMQKNTLANIYVDHKTIYVESLIAKKLSVSVIGFDGRVYESAALSANGSFIKGVDAGIYLVRLSDGSDAVVQKILVE